MTHSAEFRIWLAIAGFALVAMAPLAWALWAPVVARGRRAAAMELHRGQLAEIDRDLEIGRIGAPEHAIAKIEVQRRLLAESEIVEGEAHSSRTALYAMLLLVPLAGVLLYLPGSAPDLPAAPLAKRLADAQSEAIQAEALIAEVKAKIVSLDPHSSQAREGYVLLGNLEDTRGDLAAAADDWGRALAISFDPTLAAQVAEANSRVDGHVSPASAALFRQALAAAPANAPWRSIAEQRLASLSSPTRTPEEAAPAAR
jgi:cytochrome c-type biogenesis protein CcmH